MDSSESQGVAVFTSNENGVNCVTSIQVAEKFKRNHKDVLRQIDRLLESCKLLSAVCTLSEYKDSTGRKLPQYLLTESGYRK